MNEEEIEFWKAEAFRYQKKYTDLRYTLEEICVAPSQEEPFNSVEWYKGKAKRVLELTDTEE